MERWDAYDMEFHKAAGVTLVRGGEIPEGRFHLVCGVLVEHADGTWLVTRRARRNPSAACGRPRQAVPPWPGKRRWTAPLGSCGRKRAHLTEVGRVLSEDARAIFVEFLCRTGGEKETVSLQPGETVDYIISEHNVRK